MPGGGPSPGKRARAPASAIRPARIAPNRGRKTMAWYKRSALHHIDVFDRNRTAVAEIDHEDGKPDRRFRGRDGEHEKRINLPDDVAEMGGESDQIDIHREQDQLNRHQDDDHVLAVEEDTKDPEREQDRPNRKIMSEA